MASGAIRVRATMKGYYNHLMRMEGEVFIIKNEDAFSETWMVRVGANAVSEDVYDDASDGRTPTSMRDARRGNVVHPGKEEEVFEVEGGDEEEAEAEEEVVDAPDKPSTDAPVKTKSKAKGKGKGKK